MSLRHVKYLWAVGVVVVVVENDVFCELVCPSFDPFVCLVCLLMNTKQYSMKRLFVLRQNLRWQ
jgi:hypothetical protein